MTLPVPFARRGISLRLYPHMMGHPTAVLDELEVQAQLADTVGFDGVMLSERHGGEWGQIPNPLQVAGFLLGATTRVWVAAAPLLLPLRRPAIVAEEVAWLAARHPGRVGLGLGSGGNAPDFAAVGASFADRSAHFDRDLRALVAILVARAGNGEESALQGDLAIARARAEGLPLLSTAMSRTAVRRAATLGLDVMGSSLLGIERTRALVDDYRAAGGRGSHVVILRVWLGEPPRALMERQLAEYHADAAIKGLVAADDPAALAQQIAGAAADSQADALNLRVHVAGLAPGRAREQIEHLGREVVPLVRRQWPA